MNRCVGIILLVILGSCARGADKSPQAAAVPSPGLPWKLADGSCWEGLSYALTASDNPEADNVFTKVSQRGARKPLVPYPMGATPLAIRVELIYQATKTRETTQWTNAKTTETWAYDGFFLEENPIDGSVTVTDPRLHADLIQGMLESPFTELSWMSPEFYQGIRQVQEKSYYLYRSGSLASRSLPFTPPMAQGKMAWIDSKTGFPFASVDHDSLWLYHQVSSTSDALVLPSAFQDALKEAKARYQHLIGRYQSVVKP